GCRSPSERANEAQCMSHAREARDCFGIGLRPWFWRRIGLQVEHCPGVTGAALTKDELACSCEGRSPVPGGELDPCLRRGTVRSGAAGRVDVAQDPAALRDGLDELGAAAGVAEFLAQLRNEHVDDLGLRLVVGTAVEML